jgi:hypothetical protein
LIDQTDEKGQIIVSSAYYPGDKISATDLTNILVKQLFTGIFARKAPFISSILMFQ